MVSINTASTLLLGAVCLSSLFDTAAADRDTRSFTSEAYPTIATVGACFIFFYTLYYSAAKTGFAGWRNHALWFLFDVLLFMFGIFLIFGPDTVYNSATDGYLSAGFTGNYLSHGPRAAIIGFQLAAQAALGIFAIYSANAYASLVYGILGIFNILCLMGSNYLFNYNEPIWLLSEAECRVYFRVGTGESMQRCHDDGYLEFLRIIGTIAIVLEGYLIVISLLAYATAVPAYGHDGVGVPAHHTGGLATGGHHAGHHTGPGGYAGGPGTTATGGYPAGTYGTATAGPGFVTQQGGNNNNPNVGNTGVATTTTGYAQQPYAQTTTTHTTHVQ